jgi:hypothetical protein
MVTQRWSVPLGRGGTTGLLVAQSGRIFVSSQSPVGCAAIEPSGELAWTVSGANVHGETPDGALLATAYDEHEFVLDHNGRKLQRWWVTPRGARIVGWHGITPILYTVWGGPWVESFKYSFHDFHLHRCDQAGRLVDKVPISRELFRARLLEAGVLPAYRSDKFLEFSSALALCYNPRRRRLIAYGSAIHGWVMSLQLDGTPEWLVLPSITCCNSICLVGDEVTVQVSSCGRRVSFLAVDGSVIRSHDVHGHTALSNDRGTVFVIGYDALFAFDHVGEPLWKLDIADIQIAALRDTVLYAVTSAADGQTLLAIDVA